jgi:hypothetical protein
MRSKYLVMVVVLLVLAFGVGRLSAAPGTLDSPAPPGSTSSYTPQQESLILHPTLPTLINS